MRCGRARDAPPRRVRATTTTSRACSSRGARRRRGRRRTAAGSARCRRGRHRGTGVDGRRDRAPCRSRSARPAERVGVGRQRAGRERRLAPRAPGRQESASQGVARAEPRCPRRGPAGRRRRRRRSAAAAATRGSRRRRARRRRRRSSSAARRGAGAAAQSSTSHRSPRQKPSAASVSACLRSKCRSSQSSLEKVLPQYAHL